MNAWCLLKGHTNRNQLKDARFFKYVWPFSGHQALKCYKSWSNGYNDSAKVTSDLKVAAGDMKLFAGSKFWSLAHKKKICGDATSIFQDRILCQGSQDTFFEFGWA